jgi:glycosyltransferase involved in cell wall biosynthesis
MESPRITIVTPSFNQAGFLEATIRSVLSQNYPNLEYIIMDGGSTDGSVRIIQTYADRLAHWESRRDAGQGDAIQRGFERSTGDILGWLNSDDLLLPGSLQRIGEYFASRPRVDCVVAGCLTIDPGGCVVRGRFGLRCINLGASVTFHKLLLSKYHGFNQPATFWRRPAFFAVGGIDRSLQFCLDFDLFLRLSRKKAFGRLKEFVACYRSHPASKTNRLEDVCLREATMLWTKYGRQRYSRVYRTVFPLALTSALRARYLLLNLCVSCGVVRLPPLSSQ